MTPYPQAHHVPAPASSPLAQRFASVRAQTLRLAQPLSADDCQAQSMPDASPVKWHLAHVTWFFETFVLEAFEPDFKAYNPAFKVLFNSYYNAVGDKHPRPQRGLLTRPSLQEVLLWRQSVDARVVAVLTSNDSKEIAALVELGLEHEQQHQELLLTDVKHLLFCNGLRPIYRKAWPLAAVAPVPMRWLDYAGGLVEVGSAGDGFAFDNETPRHTQFLRPYALANRLVTHGEWLEFMHDGGYTDPRWWLSAGWEWRCSQQITAPLYWSRPEVNAGSGTADPSGDPAASAFASKAASADHSADANANASTDTNANAQASWRSFTLHGEVPIDPHTPITHISYFEVDAFARWKSATHADWNGARLPTEI